MLAVQANNRAPAALPQLPPARQVRLLLNARVQVLPATLTAIVRESMASVANENAAKISAVSHSAF